MSGPIYLDHNSTTPVAPQVVEAMTAALRDVWGNPSSAHIYGTQAREAIERARRSVAALLGCDPDEILLTSGGTESNNAAVVGVAEAQADRGRHLVISAVEHAAVDEPCRYLESRGWSVTRVGVDDRGQVDAAEVEAAMRPDTVLVSVMHSNNETGVLQPIEAIARAARARGILVHSDAAQSVGKIFVDVKKLDVDLLTVAGHKLYAPKGVGALYLRRGVPFRPFLKGAAHESGRRAGTENVPEIVGLGAACDLAAEELEARTANLRATRDRLESKLREAIPDLVVHGGSVPRLPNTLSAAFPGVDAGSVVSELEGVATSAGPACHSGERAEPSKVLTAMGVPPDLAFATLRLTTGRSTTLEQIDTAARLLIEAIGRVRRSKPSGIPTR
jgi:cysteine desulfurase